MTDKLPPFTLLAPESHTAVVNGFHLSALPNREYTTDESLFRVQFEHGGFIEFRPTTPAPVAVGERMVHDLEAAPVEPHHSINARVAKLEATVKESVSQIDRTLELISQRLTERYAATTELTRIMSDLSQKVGRCEGADTAFGLRLDGLEATVKTMWERVYAAETPPLPTPTEPEPGDDADYTVEHLAIMFGLASTDFTQCLLDTAAQLGLVHREPVVIEVTGGDVEAAWDAMRSVEGPFASRSRVRTALEAFAARVNARQEGV